MRRNFDGTVKSFDGKDIVERNEAGELVPVFVRVVTVNALMAPEQGTSGEDQLKRYNLAEKIFPGGDVELTAAEIELINRQVAKGYGPIVTGFIHRLLEKDPT